MDPANSGTPSGKQPPSHAEENLRGVLPLKRYGLKNLLTFIFSLALFLLALELMKSGAASLTPTIQELMAPNDPFAGLGFGWLASYVVLSGSPIAAVALALFDANTIGDLSAFMMIAGSRMGASLIVMFVGLLYILRGHGRQTSLLTGLLAMIITGSVFVPALPVGLLLLRLSEFRFRIGATGGAALSSLLETVLGPPVQLATSHLPGYGVFALGLLLTVASLSLIDRSLPEIDLQDNVFSGVARLLYRPSVSFVLGVLLTLVTMSVSVSLSLLVPLSVRGYIRRENLVPYIMGCNISTFVDTLIAGILLRNPGAIKIVLIQMLAVALISMLVLAFAYRPFERLALRLAVWLNHTRTRLAGFTLIALMLPLLLLNL